MNSSELLSFFYHWIKTFQWSWAAKNDGSLP